MIEYLINVHQEITSADKMIDFLNASLGAAMKYVK